MKVSLGFERACKELCYLCNMKYVNFKEPANHLQLMRILNKYYPTAVELNEVIIVDNLVKYCIDFINEDVYDYECRDLFKRVMEVAIWER